MRSGKGLPSRLRDARDPPLVGIGIAHARPVGADRHRVVVELGVDQRDAGVGVLEQHPGALRDQESVSPDCASGRVPQLSRLEHRTQRNMPARARPPGRPPASRPRSAAPTMDPTAMLPHIRTRARPRTTLCPAACSRRSRAAAGGATTPDRGGARAIAEASDRVPGRHHDPRGGAAGGRSHVVRARRRDAGRPGGASGSPTGRRAARARTRAGKQARCVEDLLRRRQAPRRGALGCRRADRYVAHVVRRRHAASEAVHRAAAWSSSARFRPDGSKQREGTFVNGREDGTWTEWDAGGVATTTPGRTACAPAPPSGRHRHRRVRRVPGEVHALHRRRTYPRPRAGRCATRWTATTKAWQRGRTNPDQHGGLRTRARRTRGRRKATLAMGCAW